MVSVARPWPGLYSCKDVSSRETDRQGLGRAALGCRLGQDWKLQSETRVGLEYERRLGRADPNPREGKRLDWERSESRGKRRRLGKIFCLS